MLGYFQAMLEQWNAENTQRYIKIIGNKLSITWNFEYFECSKQYKRFFMLPMIINTEPNVKNMYTNFKSAN